MGRRSVAIRIAWMIEADLSGDIVRELREARREGGRGEWPAPPELVHPKWESCGRVSHGGTHEQAKDRPGSRAYPARSRP